MEVLTSTEPETLAAPAPSVGDDPTATQASRAALTAIAPEGYSRELKFSWIDPGGNPIDKVYIQEQLGYLPVQEFTTRISEILDMFTQGEMRMKLGELFRGEVKMPVTLDEQSVNRFMDDNMVYVEAFLKLIKIVPDLQLDIFLLSLGVPRLERPWAKQQLQEPPSRGGPTVPEGFDLLIHFIKQNGPLLRETLVGKARELGDVFMLHVMGQIPDLEGTATEPETTTEEFASLGGMPSSITSPATPASD